MRDPMKRIEMEVAVRKGAEAFQGGGKGACRAFAAAPSHFLTKKQEGAV